jgi:hypothetical protein
VIRYFRTTVSVYELIAAKLDAAYGYPNSETKTLRAIPLASDLPTDSEGRVYLAIDGEYCDFILPSEMLPQLIDSGMAEEIDEATYGSILPPV